VSVSESTKAITSFIKRLPKGDCVPPPEGRSTIEELVYSFLLWESTTSRADNAFKRVGEQFVDLNDLRVSREAEVQAALGKTYPLLEERVLRMHSALQDIYRREHEVSLASLEPMSKRDARKYLESLEGMVPYVAARVTLFSLGGHAIPVEERLVRYLESANVVEEGADVVKVTGSFERQIKAEDAVQSYLKLQHFSETGGGKSGGARTTTRKKTTAAKRTTSKKKAASKSRAAKTSKKTTKRTTTRKKSSG
jgi:endonuclease III